MRQYKFAAGSRRLIILRALIFFCSLFLISGCVRLTDVETSQEHTNAQIAIVEKGRSVGQTFVPRRSGLDTIQLWITLVDDDTPLGNATLNLYNIPGNDFSLRTVTIDLAQIGSANPVTFEFRPLENYSEQPLYLELTVDSSSILVYGRDEDQYPKGSAYIDRVPAAVDLAFRTSYTYNLHEFLIDVKFWAGGLWLIFPAILLLIFPGYLLLGQAKPGDDLIIRSTTALGLSLSIIPIILTWTTLIGLSWNRTSTWIVTGIIGIVATHQLWRSFRSGVKFHIPAHVLALVLLTLFTLVTRLIMIRELALPAWVDSVHHAVITKLILDHGAIPSSFAPLINIDSSSYHPGYHAGLAFFTWLSGLQVEEAMLIYGQLLNALIVPAIYLITIKLGGNRWSGVFAGLIAGLFTPMPAYYTSWGRYTHLTGLLILPTTFTLVNDTIYHFNPRRLILAAISGAGLFLVHYRLAAFLGILLISKWGIDILASLLKRNFNKKYISISLRRLGHVVVSAVIGILIISPWMVDVFKNLFIPKITQWEGSNLILFEGFTWNLLTTAWGRQAMGLAGLGLLWAIARNPRLAFTQILWILSLLFFANVGPLGLPGASFISNLSVAISLFVPTAILGGYFLGALCQLPLKRLNQQFILLYKILLVLSVSIIAVFSAQDLIPIMRQVTFLGRQADRAAIQWISANLPQGEIILINPTIWGYNLYQGNDGGYWISPLSGHPTLPPPVLYGLDNDLTRIQDTNTVIESVLTSGTNPSELYKIMVNHGIDYVYIGARGGILSPRHLLDSSLFKPLYQMDGTWLLGLVHN